MRPHALLLALLLAARTAASAPVEVNTFTRAVDTGALRVTFDLENPDRLAEVLLRTWSRTENLAGADDTGWTEYFGQSLRGTALGGFTYAPALILATWDVIAQDDSTLTVRAETWTDLQPPVRTDWRFTGGSAQVRVERTVYFSLAPDSAAFQPFVPRMAFLTNYRTARWRTAAGAVSTGVLCFGGCAVTSWDGRWVEFEAREGDAGYGLAVAPASSNPAYAGFVRGYGAESNGASVAPLRPAGLHDRDEVHRFVLAFGITPGDTTALDSLQARLDAALPPLAAPPAPPPGLSLRAAPNPARGDVRLAWTMPRAGHVTLALYDASGRRVTTLHDGPAAAGAGSARWNGALASGAYAPPGVYLAVLRTERGTVTRRLVRLR
jgi:hypothetical protein